MQQHCKDKARTPIKANLIKNTIFCYFSTLSDIKLVPHLKPGPETRKQSSNNCWHLAWLYKKGCDHTGRPPTSELVGYCATVVFHQACLLHRRTTHFLCEAIRQSAFWWFCTWWNCGTRWNEQMRWENDMQTRWEGWERSDDTVRSDKSRIINLQRCQWKKKPHTHKTHHQDVSEMINDYCVSDAFIAFMVSCITRGNRCPLPPRPSVLIHTSYTNYGGKGLGEIILDYMKISFLDLPHQVFTCHLFN